MSKVNINLGTGFCSTLTILFIGLKLTHYISWSWWWILSPLWIPLALALVIFIVVLIVLGIIGIINNNIF